MPSMNWISIGSGNGLSPLRCQAITWTNAGLLSIGLLGTNFSEKNRNSVIFIQENTFEIIVCQYGGHFVQGEIPLVSLSAPHHQVEAPNYVV